MTRGLSLSFLLLTACIPDSPEDISKKDKDGDGFIAAEDCDDWNENTHPGAFELCDGLDNNCDGSISDPEFDSDGDGYVGCEVEEGGWAGPNEPQGGGDCDESNAAINPGADEQCDGQNNDCDGETDEDDAVGASRWLPDLDGDGYGSEGIRDSCYQPEHHIPEEGVTSFDCNDDDATVYPGAFEICDGQDNDCVDGTPAIEIDNDGDNYVQCAEIAEVWVGPRNPNPPGPGDCDDNDASVSPAATEACDGIDNNCDGIVDEQGATGETAWYADTDADGYGDQAHSFAGCVAPSGFIADDTDCDDLDATVNPLAAELCDGQDNDCDLDLPENESDADNDGYVECLIDVDGWDGAAISGGFDCDDGDSEIFPGAEEFCDSTDNNCDGDIDEPSASDATIWYADDDEDGYGDPNDSLTDCIQPTDMVADSTDCNDQDGNVYPSAIEICDTVDNDCDGTIDEDDAQGTLTWYLDADGDGYGLTSNSVQACSQPSGYAALDDDCDDSVDTVHPNAHEDCGNGVDDNCSGTADDNTSTTSWIPWYRDDDNDGYGQPANAVSACAALSGKVATGGDCNDANSGINPGATEICNNSTDDDCDNSTDCNDSDCSSSCSSGGSETTLAQCYDGNDNDGDGYIDCYDCDCSYLSPLCDGITCQGGGSNGSTCSGSNTTECDDGNCSDGQDNDGDSLIDCCDPDCSSATWCTVGGGTCSNTTSAYEVCTSNGDDDNANGADCDDPTCTDVFTPSCTSGTTTNAVTGGLLLDDQFLAGDCGGMHTCVLVFDNDHYEPECWGDDSKGQSTIPTALSLTVDEEYAGIATGGLHTCVAINHSNRLESRAVCWGDASEGQAGSRSFSHEIQQITAGTAHTCALFSDGTVYCWGDQTYMAATPPTGGNNTTFTSIDAGGYHTCGILDGNTDDPNGIVCWGRNDVSQAGSDTPHEFDYVAAGDLHTCGVTSSSSLHPNQVICWGNNDYYQTSNKPSATVDYNRLSSNGHHTCVEILSSTGIGSLECWGWGDTNTTLHDGQTETTTAHGTSIGLYLSFCAGGRHTFSAASNNVANDYGFSGDYTSGQDLCSNLTNVNCY